MPRTMMTSLMRPVMNNSPASSMKPRSPVRSQNSSSPSIRARNVDVVGFEPPPGFRIDDRDALADNISAASDHTMRIVVTSGSSNLMALKGLAADRPYDRPGAPA